MTTPAASSATVAPSGPAAGGNARATSGAPGCVAPGGSDQGVSGDHIKIAIVVINLYGATANKAVGLPSAAQQEGYFQDVVDAINASGGVACHYKLVAQYFPTNSIDSSSLEQTCLDIEQAKVYALVDYGGYFQSPSLAACFPENHIPYISVALSPKSELQQYYPYIVSVQSTMEVLYRYTVFALAARGFFSSASGFKRLGFLYRDCVPQEPSEIEGWLQQVGVASSQIVPYDLGCPSAFASPAVLEQAVVKFKEAGVTHVTEAQTLTDFGSFTKVAEQQSFRPKYGIPDDAIVSVTGTSLGPDYNNIADAIAITGTRYGEEDTPGTAPAPGTVKCNAIFQAHGMPPVYQQPLGIGGAACDDLWLLATAIGHAPVLHRDALAAGLERVGSVETSWPFGPNDFGPGVTTGQEFWRPLQFFTSCDCWRVLDPTFRQ